MIIDPTDLHSLCAEPRDLTGRPLLSVTLHLALCAFFVPYLTC